MAAFMNIPRAQKLYTERRQFSDDVYRKLFRFHRENVSWMADHFLNDTGETRGAALSNVQQMEVFLRSLGDPGFQQGVAIDIGIHQTTVSKVIKHVSSMIYTKCNLWIKFPNTDELLNAAVTEWTMHKQLPVIGAIDCTHVKITKPSIHGDEYINGKGVCSINIQATCNGKEIFTGVDASWPGSVHNSRIWQNSLIYKIMCTNQQGALLLGDESYGISPWMLTPFKNATTDVENMYNAIHSKERIVIERCFGQLKRRFPMLGYTIRLKIDTVCRYVMCAFILHNVSKYLQDPIEDFDPVQIEDIPVVREMYVEVNPAEIRRQGVQRRNEIAAAIFNQ